MSNALALRWHVFGRPYQQGYIDTVIKLLDVTLGNAFVKYTTHYIVFFYQRLFMNILFYFYIDLLDLMTNKLALCIYEI